MINRFNFDEDNDLIDDYTLEVYSLNSSKDWIKLVNLLNKINDEKLLIEDKYNDFIKIFIEEFEEYNKCIDEYSLMKIDILMDLAEKLDIDLD